MESAASTIGLVIMAVSAVLTWAWIFYRSTKSAQSAERLAEIVRDIHAGTAPIDELNQFGKWPALTQAIHEVFRELRQQKQEIKQINNEMRQRVSNRTNALERMIGSLKNQATRDPLTGLHNRRMLDELLPRLVTQCRDVGMSLALLMIDVDYFKDLNDTLGHAVGDEMLRSLGQIISSTIREKDAGFRVGGDEFVILLPGCDKSTAQAIGQRLQSLTEAMARVYRVGRLPRLSIGICLLAELSEPTAENLLRRADQMLYAVKQSRGSSRVPAIESRVSADARDSETHAASRRVAGPRPAVRV